MKKYLIVIDQGTTSSRVVLIDSKTKIIDQDFIEIKRKDNSNSEVLTDANEILFSVKDLLKRLFQRNNLDPKLVSSISITNQRETTVLWSAKTGKPISDAISWQSKHTNYITDKWIELGYTELVFDKTGLLINPYFSASKIKHLLINNNFDINNIKFGTIDSFLIYNCFGIY